MADWIRTCQECGNQQKAKQPATNREVTDRYANSKCRKCKSPALDYGQIDDVDEYWADA